MTDKYLKKWLPKIHLNKQSQYTKIYWLTIDLFTGNCYFYLLPTSTKCFTTNKLKQKSQKKIRICPLFLSNVEWKFVECKTLEWLPQWREHHQTFLFFLLWWLYLGLWAIHLSKKQCCCNKDCCVCELPLFPFTSTLLSSQPNRTVSTLTHHFI